jgi:cobalt-zinc-cadmium efflux system outer membrane protein
MTQVRGGYFAVLVAEQNLHWSGDLSEFTERVYSISVENAVQGLLAGYEPMQLRALALQARGAREQARNRYLTAWRQLAAALGLPDMPITELAGNAEMPVPVFDKFAALGRIRTDHTDLLTARNSQQRARYDLESARRQPYPDLDLRVVVQKDYTTPPFAIAENVQAGFTIPVWDRNQGNIKQAQATLLRAVEEEHRVQADLSSRLAEAFERYENNRALADYYRNILEDLSRVYTRTLLRFNTQPATAEDKVGFVDITTNQQLYVNAVTAYAGVLQALWQAAVDVAGLAQIDEFFLGMPATSPNPVNGCPLPCGHPCNPLPPSGQPVPPPVHPGTIVPR